jgi:hypothetical protein
MVDLPAPESPVSQMQSGFWLFVDARIVLSSDWVCQWILVAALVIEIFIGVYKGACCIAIIDKHHSRNSSRFDLLESIMSKRL